MAYPAPGRGRPEVGTPERIAANIDVFGFSLDESGTPCTRRSVRSRWAASRGRDRAVRTPGGPGRRGTTSRPRNFGVPLPRQAAVAAARTGLRRSTGTGPSDSPPGARPRRAPPRRWAASATARASLVAGQRRRLGEQRAQAGHAAPRRNSSAAITARSEMPAGWLATLSPRSMIISRSLAATRSNGTRSAVMFHVSTRAAVPSGTCGRPLGRPRRPAGPARPASARALKEVTEHGRPSQRGEGESACIRTLVQVPTRRDIPPERVTGGPGRGPPPPADRRPSRDVIHIVERPDLAPCPSGCPSAGRSSRRPGARRRPSSPTSGDGQGEAVAGPPKRGQPAGSEHDQGGPVAEDLLEQERGQAESLGSASDRSDDQGRRRPGRRRRGSCDQRLQVVGGPPTTWRRWSMKPSPATWSTSTSTSFLVRRRTQLRLTCSWTSRSSATGPP